MPRNLVATARRDGWQEWLETIPTTVRDLEKRWSLVVGDPFNPGGQISWVAPVRDANSSDLVLKVAWRHTEALHEADGLRAWKGTGAVRLHAASDDDDTLALLLERCVPGTALSTLPEEEQDPIIVGLVRRLWIDPPDGYTFRPLQLMCDKWADEFEQKIAQGRRVPLDPGLARQGIELLRTLPASAEQAVLLCTDLHAGNVLAAEREPWLVIDPKPYLGDPVYDLLQHLLNCQRLLSDPRTLVQRVAALAGIDPDRLLLWLFARCVQESPDQPRLGEVAHLIAPG